MQISVIGRHVEVTEAIRRYAEDKAAKLDRLYDRLEAVDVIIDKVANRFRTELVVRAGHKHTFVAQMDGSLINESLDLALDKMERQLRAHKERTRNHKHSERAGEDVPKAEGQDD